MKHLKTIMLAITASTLIFTACDDKSNNNDITLGDKNGILLVTFGSSYEAPQATFKNMSNAAKTKFTNTEIRWGFTSDIILNKLRQGNGEGELNGIIIDNDTPEEALETMIKEGYSKFTVQSMHVIPGEEFDEMIETVEAIKTKYPRVEFSIGKPLLDSETDIKAVAKVMAAKFTTQITEGPVCFMGHGTPHMADSQYIKLQNALQAINPNFFVGTVEGIGFEAETTSIGNIIKSLNAISPKPNKVTITPLMSIAGDHANNDMNGVTGETDPAEQSWRERLEAEGYTVTDVMKGLGDYDEINAIWMSHLSAAE
ncbi:MAG: sirohydrochlorin cobaltochelatase [Marinilabiliaceae bacterium]|nr:sirohydrochlorin cobaltochelatase [Marinilabiliaceae bacterium]